MATHSSILAWKIQWTEEPRGLQSMRSQILSSFSLYFRLPLLPLIHEEYFISYRVQG